MDEQYVVLSMKDEKSKDIAKVLSNDTSRKILEKIATKAYSPNQISKALGVPLSTVEYNLDLLKKANMIRVKGYNYSKKGKRVDHYEPARKLIVIAPEESSKASLLEAIKDKLVLLISGLAVGVGYFGQRAFAKPAVLFAETAVKSGVAGAPVEDVALRAGTGIAQQAANYDLYVFLVFAILFVATVLYYFWRGNVRSK